MAVYVDKGRAKYRGMRMCHMIADTADELHAMADAIGIKRKWFQSPPRASFPHYDISSGKRALAIKAGAIEMDRREFVYAMRAIRQRIAEGEAFC